MAYTWGDIKKTALSLMFTAEGEPDAGGFLSAMPEAANYALRDLALVCRPVYAKLSISHVPVENMLGESLASFQTVQSAGDDVVYVAHSPKAYYFEVDRPCTVLLEQLDGAGNALAITSHTHGGGGGFTAYRGLVPLPGTIRLRFLGDRLYNIRNVAFYAAPFALAADVPPFTRFDRYNIRELTGENGRTMFMRLAPNSVVVTGDGQHRRSDEFQWEPDGTLVIDRRVSAQYDVFYQRYPTPVTKDTANGFALDEELPPEALDIVPYFIAGRLFAEDDPQKAAGYRNHYRTRRAELSQDGEPIGETAWNCESGWW